MQSSNTTDFAPAIIEHLTASFAPQRIDQMIRDRTFIVAETGSEIVGTAPVAGQTMRRVFVAASFWPGRRKARVWGVVRFATLNASPGPTTWWSGSFRPRSLPKAFCV